MPIYQYDKSPEQVARLKEVAEAWVETNRFWSVGLTMDAASRPGSLILYFADDSEGPWQGAALCEVGPYDSELLYVYTRPEARGRGIAEALLVTLADKLKSKRQMESMFLEVRVSNSGAIRLYEKLGMERISVRRKYYGDGEDAFVYRWRFRGEG